VQKPPVRLRNIFRVPPRLPGIAGIFSPLVPLVPLVLTLAPLPCVDADAHARPPRAERVADRIAERRYARMSIAEARVARAEARVAEIAPVVPVPPPPRPATLRRMARAGVPLGGPTPPPVVATRPLGRPPVIAGQPPAGPPALAARQTPPSTASAATPPRLAPSATAARPAAPPPATEPGAWTLDPDEGVAPASAAIAPDGTRSVLSAGGSPPAPAATPKPAAPAAGRPGPTVTQTPIELLPTPEAK
jgi:hypothetical protein